MSFDGAVNAWFAPQPEPSDEALRRIGRGLRAARRRSRLTQRALERSSGVPQSTISRNENGLRPTAKATTLARLIHVLGEVEIPPRQHER